MGPVLLRDIDSCAHWLLHEEITSLHLHLTARDRVAAASVLEKAFAVPTEPDVDSVLIAEVISALQMHNESFGRLHSIGNDWRGFPGTGLLEIPTAEARALRLEKAEADDLVLFFGDRKKLDAGIRYVTRSLTIDVPYVALIFRLN